MLERKQIREIQKLYREGWGELNISRITGIGMWTVRRVLRAQGCYSNLERLQNGKRSGKELAIYANH